MKAYKVTLLIVDFDEVGKAGIEEVIENARYTNRCISPSVMDIESRDIGEWEDGNPINFRDKQVIEFNRLFGGPMSSAT